MIGLIGYTEKFAFGRLAWSRRGGRWPGSFEAGEPPVTVSVACRARIAGVGTLRLVKNSGLAGAAAAFSCAGRSR